MSPVEGVTANVEHLEQTDLIGPPSNASLGDKLAFARTPGGKLKVLRSLQAGIGHIQAMVAGDMALEMAYSAEDYEESTDWLMQASMSWEKVIALVGDRVTDTTSHAAMQLALMKNYHHHIREHSVPPVEQTSTIYPELVRIATIQADTIEDRQTPKSDAQRIAGTLGELSVLLLLQRFGIKNDDETWMPLPSLFTQDTGLGEEEVDLNKGWDVSVYTQYDASVSPELTYKVQVKTRKRANEPNYADDIALVHVGSDLDLRTGARKGAMSVTTIARECQAELASTDPDLVNISRRSLDLREDALLQILG